MKKIIILADTHGIQDALRKIRPLIEESDIVFFLGDYVTDIVKFREEYADTEFFIVKGNCDFFSLYPDELCIEIEGVKIFLTHGHKYGVKKNNMLLAERSRELGCSAVFYGHSHIAEIAEECGIKIVNPGSLGNPRAGKPSYAYATVNDGKILISLVEIQ